MTPTNSEMAQECMDSAGRGSRVNTDTAAIIDAIAAQTYATLALVDEIRDMRSFVAEYLAAAEDRAIGLTEEPS